jgi:ParB/RepB/Spo0J family partition protein
VSATATRDAQPPAGNDQPVDEFHLLHVDSLTTAGDNVRKQVGDVTELAASIKAQGMIQPIVATMRSDDEGARFVVVAGHRRLAAAKKAGLEKVPVILRSLDEQGRLEAMLAENLEREDLTPLEEAAGYQRLIDECGLTQRQLAERVNRSQGHISKRLVLLDLPEAVQAKVDSGGIPVGDAVELAKLKDHAAIERVLKSYNPHYPESLARAISNAATLLKQEERVRIREEELESKAVVTIRVTSSWNLPAGTHRLKRKGVYDAHALQISEGDHAKLPCHRVALCANGPTVDEFPVCVDRKEHPKIKTEQEADRGRGASSRRGPTAKERAAQAEREEQAKRRDDVTRELLHRKGAPIAKGAASQLITLTLLRGLDDWSHIEKACTLLGVFPPIDLSESTLARLGVAGEGPLHVLEVELESDGTATKGAGVCGLNGMAVDVDRPEKRKRAPDTATLCPQCLEQLLDGDPDELRENALLDYAAKNDTQASRAALALALAYTGGHLGFSRGGIVAGQRAYLELLKAHGYAPTKDEANLLALGKDA